MATSKTESYDPNQYVRLRTILDSLEDGSIRYYLAVQDSPEGSKRFEEIESRLMPIIEWLWGDARELICPPGYFNCNGVCVPYTCPREEMFPKEEKY
jgi:hypothetical protein